VCACSTNRPRVSSIGRMLAMVAGCFILLGGLLAHADDTIKLAASESLDSLHQRGSSDFSDMGDWIWDSTTFHRQTVRFWKAFQIPARMIVWCNHYRENLTLKNLAGMAPNYFHRRFKRVLGVTPFEYVTGERLNQARHLLASTRLTIKETADVVGYPDPLYFSRVFSRRLLMSQTKYRAAHQLSQR